MQDHLVIVEIVAFDREESLLPTLDYAYRAGGGGGGCRGK
jgi:hypothetical protein